MTIARRGLKVKVMGQANVVGNYEDYDVSAPEVLFQNGWRKSTEGNWLTRFTGKMAVKNDMMVAVRHSSFLDLNSPYS